MCLNTDSYEFCRYGLFYHFFYPTARRNVFIIQCMFDASARLETPIRLPVMFYITYVCMRKYIELMTMYLITAA